MKNTLLTTIALLFIAIGMNANTTNTYNNEQPFVFVESGIEFAVFKDGQFDFNVLRNNNGVNVRFNTRLIDFSFNAGHNYDTYVQHDEYGAVIQIENTPIFYDYYGRVNRIGNIYLNYNYNNFVSRIGNMLVTYNRYGDFRYSNGFINNYNVNYVYVPGCRTYRRPIAARVIVYNRPYRRNFRPVRCNYNTYRRNYNNNYRRGQRVTHNFRRPGKAAKRNNKRNGVIKRNSNYNTNRSSTRVANNTRRANNTKTVRNTSRKTNKRNYTTKNNVVKTRTVKNTKRNNKTRNTAPRTQRATTKINKKRNNKKFAVKNVKKYSRTKRTVASNNTRNSRR